MEVGLTGPYHTPPSPSHLRISFSSARLSLRHQHRPTSPACLCWHLRGLTPCTPRHTPAVPVTASIIQFTHSIPHDHCVGYLFHPYWQLQMCSCFLQPLATCHCICPPSNRFFSSSFCATTPWLGSSTQVVATCINCATQKSAL